jgi:hypothetical protein
MFTTINTFNTFNTFASVALARDYAVRRRVPAPP